MQWPPDYNREFQKRQANLEVLRKDPAKLEAVKLHYKNNNPIDFIQDWGTTYNPKNVPKGRLAYMPFILFPRQKEAINFIMECYLDQEAGLFEKCREVGLTWIAVAMSDYLWRFHEGSAIGWGSQTKNKVDVIGNPKSIFGKIRLYQEYIPKIFQPKGFDIRYHSKQMEIINPENGATITGEIGDDQGRGGRTSIYFKDESAHYEHPEMIDSAIEHNTDCPIDISSVNGVGNVFYRKRKAGIIWEPGKEIEKDYTRVFIVDWRDHPEKDQEWYDGKRGKAEREGLLHLFAQEVDRDYTASVEGIIIPQAWVKSAIDAHKRLKFDMTGRVLTALDVADEGGDLNALAGRKGNILGYLAKWAEGDTGLTANRAVSVSKQLAAYELHYDCIGVGAGVKAETNRLERENKLGGVKVMKWNAASKPLDPKKRLIPHDKQSPLNQDFYANLKAQAWWKVRGMFEKTHAVVTKGKEYPEEDLISISSKIDHFHELQTELSQPQYKYDSKNRIMVDKKPDGTRSPNLADAVIMAFWPVKKSFGTFHVGTA